MTKVAAKETPIFIKRKHELADILKLVESGSTSAVELLIRTMNAPDDAQIGLKIKLECANKLVDLHVKIADTISKDNLVRQIAEIKAKGLSTPLELENGGTGRKAPMINFGEVQQVGT